MGQKSVKLFIKVDFDQDWKNVCFETSKWASCYGLHCQDISKECGYKWYTDDKHIDRKTIRTLSTLLQA